MEFLETKLSYFDANGTIVCSQKPDWLYVSIGADKGLATNRLQAIICPNDNPNNWIIRVD